jgi:hypothetical protein
VKKAEDVEMRREKGAQAMKSGSARKVAKKEGQAVPVKLVLWVHSRHDSRRESARERDEKEGGENRSPKERWEGDRMVSERGLCQ